MVEPYLIDRWKLYFFFSFKKLITNAKCISKIIENRLQNSKLNFLSLFIFYWHESCLLFLHIFFRGKIIQSLASSIKKKVGQYTSLYEQNICWRAEQNLRKPSISPALPFFKLFSSNKTMIFWKQNYWNLLLLCIFMF